MITTTSITTLTSSATLVGNSSSATPNLVSHATNNHENITVLETGTLDDLFGCFDADVDALTLSLPNDVNTAGTVLFRTDDNRLTITQRPDGTCRLIRMPRPERISFGGGGAKAVVYPGAIQALEDAGARQHVKEAWGASAGAVPAALLACAASAAQIKEYVEKFPLTDVIDKRASDASGSRVQSAVDRIKSTPLGKYAHVLANWGTEAPRQFKQLNEVTKECVLGAIAAAGSELHHECATIRDELQRDEPPRNVTLGDLAVLHRHNVRGIVPLFVMAVGLEHDAPSQTVVLSADTTPDVDVSRAVFLSMAIPGLFAGTELPMPHHVKPGETKPGETMKMFDGGFALNMPHRDLLDAGTPKRDTLTIALPIAMFTQAINGKDSFTGNIGFPVANALANKIAIKDQRINMATHFAGFKFNSHMLLQEPLRKGLVIADLKKVGPNRRDFESDLALMAMDVTALERDEMQRRYEKATKERLDERETTDFDSMEKLLFALDDDDFHAVTELQWGPKSNVRTMRDEAAANLTAFAAFAREWNKTALPPGFDVDKFGPSANDAMWHEFLARRIVESSDLAVRGMLEVLRRKPELGEASPLMQTCLRMQEEKEVRNVALTIVRDVIYPAAAKAMHSAENAALLKQGAAELQAATSRKEINAALDKMFKGYRLRAPFAGLTMPLSPAGLKETGEFINATVMKPAVILALYLENEQIKGELDALKNNLTTPASLEDLCTVLKREASGLHGQVGDYLSRLNGVVRSSFLRSVPSLKFW
jgi:exoenzyme U